MKALKQQHARQNKTKPNGKNINYLIKCNSGNSKYNRNHKFVQFPPNHVSINIALLTININIKITINVVCEWP